MRAELGLGAGVHCTGRDRAAGEARSGHKAALRGWEKPRRGPTGWDPEARGFPTGQFFSLVSLPHSLAPATQDAPNLC